MSISSLSALLITHATGVTGTVNSWDDGTMPPGVSTAQLPAWICLFEGYTDVPSDFSGRGRSKTYVFRHRLLLEAVGQRTLAAALKDVRTMVAEYATDLAANPFLSDTGVAGIGRVTLHIPAPGIGSVKWAEQDYFGSDILVTIEEVF